MHIRDLRSDSVYISLFQLWLFLLSSCVRKFGLSAFYTIYQDYADHELQLSLTESGTAATIYGAVAVCACAVVSVTHAYGWTYNKILALTTTALLQGVSILLVSTSASEVFIFGLVNPCQCHSRLTRCQIFHLWMASL